ncbi:response regulator [Winogradskyella sp.]|uniref:response regulator n=1 Tax=Winogradskyella sp. TaxID=1883156 RepID=UPI0025FB5F61|nr:response regulator [Winogradskyella sp.]
MSYGQTERGIIISVDSINSLALRHYNDNDIVNSFNLYNESYRLSDSINDNYGNAVANFNLGKIYNHMQEYDKAQGCYTQMLDRAKVINDNFLTAISYFNLGKLKKNSNQLDAAVSFYKKALQYALNEEVIDQNNEDKRNHILFDIRINLADVYIERKEQAEALTYLFRAKNSLEHIKSTDYCSKGNLSYTYGLYFMGKGSYNLANNKFNEAQRYLKKCSSNVVDIKCNLLLSQVYKKLSLSLVALDKKDEAYNALVKYNEAREQFFSAEKIKQEQIAESKFLIANYKQEAQSAIKEKLVQQHIASRVKFLNIGFAFVIIILLISFVVIYKNYLAKQKLSNVLKNRNEQLEIAKNQAEKSSELKTNFISNVTHELRTPLYGVVGLTSLLLNNNDLSKKDSKYLKSLKYSGDYLLNLVNDILQIGKMDSEKVELKSVSVELKVLVENIINSFQNRLQETNNQIQIDIDDAIPQLIKCDNVRLSQILINLIGNSVKFTESGKICLRIIMEDITDNNIALRFEIEDNGPGIEKAKHKKIFENFSQLHENNNVNYQGTGLGLSIVKNLVELFKGKIELESELGKGSKFSFNVTFKIDKDALKNSSKKKDNDKVVALKRGFRILVAEDNKINQIVTQNLLKKENFECQIVQNGQEAVDALKENHFDLILMDINMPIMNGNEATKEIRKGNPRIPIIALTAADIEEVKKEYMSIGYNGVITKPFDNYEFFQMINANIQDNILEKVS